MDQMRTRRLMAPCCAGCYNRRRCETRDGKCRDFERWFVSSPAWAEATEVFRQLREHKKDRPETAIPEAANKTYYVTSMTNSMKKVKEEKQNERRNPDYR